MVDPYPGILILKIDENGFVIELKVYQRCRDELRNEFYVAFIRKIIATNFDID